MADTHIRIFYGKYLDDISTEIPNDDILIDDIGEIEFDIEPGEPNIPTGGDFEIPLANLTPKGVQKYPYSFWQSIARTQEEGATIDMQVFFRVEVLGKDQFVGVFEEVSYSERDAKCLVKLDDLAFILESETRSMLKGFKMRNLLCNGVHGPNYSDQGIEFNQYPALKDIEGADMLQESITFTIIPINVGRSIGTDRVRASRTVQKDARDDFIDHMNIPTKFIESRGELREVPDYLSFDVTRNTFVQIGDITIFTKVRFFGVEGPSSDGVWMTIYHNGESIDTNNNVLPIGHFYANEELEELKFGERYDITIYDYDLGNSPEIIIKDTDLPAYDNYLFGTSYEDKGSYLQLSTEAYTFFDVVEKTFTTINGSVSGRFAGTSFSGQIEVTEGSKSGSGGVKGEFAIEIRQAPYDFEYLVINSPQIGGTRAVPTLPSFTPQQIAQNLKNALEISIDFSRIFDFEVNNTSGNYWEVRGKTKQNTTTHNGKSVNLFAQIYEQYTEEFEENETFGEPEGISGPQRITDFNNYRYEFPKTSFIYNPKSVTGGSGGGYAGDDVIRVSIGGSPVAQTPFIPAGQTPQQVASQIASSINGETNPYTATVDDDLVNIATDKGINEDIFVDVGVTGVEVNVTAIENEFQLFDTSKLLDRNRLAFYADPVMFGWIDKDLIEVLIGCVWQTTSYFYALPNGKVAVHSRDYHESLPSDVSTGIFTEVKSDDIQPAGQTDYGGGFKTYQIKRPLDIVGINNLESDDDTDIFANANGLVRNPSNNNKRIKSSNYRTSNLGHPSSIANAPAGAKIIRLSPEESQFPGAAEMKDFLPTAEEQVIRFARSFDYPTITRPVKVKYRLYQNIEIGDYIYTDIDQKLYLVKSTSLSPRELSLRLDLEFKKQLSGFFQTNTEGIEIGEEFVFRQKFIQENEESLSVSEDFKQSIKVKYEEAIIVEDESKSSIRMIYEDSLSLDEEFLNDQ